MQMVTKHRATVAVCKSRDLHWGLLATKDHRELNLSSLRLLTVADGANPWSLSSCDQFLSVFQVCSVLFPAFDLLFGPYLDKLLRFRAQHK